MSVEGNDFRNSSIKNKYYTIFEQQQKNLCMPFECGMIKNC